MKFRSQLFILIASCCISLAAAANDAPWYEVEIIIFEQSSQPRLESENWDQEVVLPDTIQSRNFLTPEPSEVTLDQLCLNGEILNITEAIPVTEIIFSENVLIEDEPVTETVDQLFPDRVPGRIADLNSNLQVEFDELGSTLEEQQKPEEKPFIILDKELNQLNELKKTLSRRRGYNPLLHVSWRQPVLNERKSQSIRLFAGNNYSETFNHSGDARVNIASVDPNFIEESNSDQNVADISNAEFTDEPVAIPFGLTSLEPSDELMDEAEAEIDYAEITKNNIVKCQQIYQQQADKMHPDVWQLDGKIKLYVERYLHLNTDLFLRIPGKEEIQLGAIMTSLAADKLLSSLELNLDDLNTENSRDFGWQLDDDFLLDDQNQTTVMQDVLNKYGMQQSRRIRSNEIHYIDHPLFGLLIQIRPYDKDAEDVPTTTL